MKKLFNRKAGLDAMTLATRVCMGWLFVWSSMPCSSARAVETWQSALTGMPLKPGVRELSRTNCVAELLGAFRSNQVVKALIFMPGATDEFYMFRRAKAVLTNTEPSLLDAVTALTNQTLIHATFYPPLLLLHTDEDPSEPILKVEDARTADRLKHIRFVPHAEWNDRDWEFVQPILKKRLHAEVRPWRFSADAWHFYRHSCAASGLTGWEALEMVTLAGKTCVTIRHNQLVFEGDTRVRVIPKFTDSPH
jgi:hypothetical protein